MSKPCGACREILQQGDLFCGSCGTPVSAIGVNPFATENNATTNSVLEDAAPQQCSGSSDGNVVLRMLGRFLLVTVALVGVEFLWGPVSSLYYPYVSQDQIVSVYDVVLIVGGAILLVLILATACRNATDWNQGKVIPLLLVTGVGAAAHLTIWFLFVTGVIEMDISTGDWFLLIDIIPIAICSTALLQCADWVRTKKAS